MDKQIQSNYLIEMNASAATLFLNENTLNSQDVLLLTRISNFLDQHLQDATIQMPDVAKATFLSRTQLFRRVKRATGKSPSLFLRSLRLHKAKILLKQSNNLIKEIAWKVGFSDAVYFSRVFKKEFDLCPSKMRKNYLKERLYGEKYG